MNVLNPSIAMHNAAHPTRKRENGEPMRFVWMLRTDVFVAAATMPTMGLRWIMTIGCVI